jgi:very-short-patch-repair endonuclease
MEKAPLPNPPPQGGRGLRRTHRTAKKKFTGKSRYHHINDPEDYKRAQGLRREMPRVERILWKALRELPKESGLTFRRQHPLRPYIADFVCLKIKLVIELDGESHDTRQEYDRRRDHYLRKLGYTVLRFTNDDVLNNLGGVVETIADISKKLSDTGAEEALPPCGGGLGGGL